MRNKELSVCAACLGVLGGAVSVLAATGRPVPVVVVDARGDLLTGASVVYSHPGEGAVVPDQDGTFVVKSAAEKFILSVKHNGATAAVEVAAPRSDDLILVIQLAGDQARTKFVKDWVAPVSTTSAVPPAPRAGAPGKVLWTDERTIVSDPAGLARSTIWLRPVSGPGTSVQGGDTCGSAAVIGALPFSTTATTVGYADDYDEICPYDAPGSPDVVYSFVPGSDMAVNIDLCASLYDTKVYVYEGSCPGNLVACNDDACGSDGYKSMLSGIELYSGNTYYIVVDGYIGDAGDYTLYIDPSAPGPDCPVYSLFAQGATAPAGAWSAGTSDESPGYLRFETYSVSDPVCAVHFWGLDLYHDGSVWTDCVEDPMPFNVKFWADAGGQPGAEVCNYTVTPTRTPTGLLYSGYELNLYEVGLPGCCALLDGWISIQGIGDPDCWFLWLSSDTGDGVSMVWDGAAMTLDDFDLSMCLIGPLGPSGACCPGDGTCIETAELVCTSMGGNWTEAEECNPNPCPRVFGACCDDWNCVCTDCVELEDCTAVTERWAAETLCDDLDPPCTMITGACCMPDASCDETWPHHCVDSGGDYQGHDVACPANACALCGLYCPPTAGDENEPDCGQPEDTVNGGCGSHPHVFSPVACGETICGTAVWDGSTRDTDWYSVTVAEDTVLTWTATAEFPYLIGLMEMDNPGSGDCLDWTGYLAPYVFAYRCEEASVTTMCLPAGEHWLYMSPDWDGPPFECGAEYLVTLECGECPLGACCPGDNTCDVTNEAGCPGDWLGAGTDCDPNPCPIIEVGSNCWIPYALMLPANLPFSDPGQYTCGRFDDYPDTCLGFYDGGEEMIYELIVTEPVGVQIMMDPAENWTGIALDDSCPPDEDCIWTSTASSGGHVSPCLQLTPGTYTIMVDSWPWPDCLTAFDLTITACEEPTGACCINEVCTATTEQQDCPGSWFEGEECPAYSCPQPCLGDTCEDALVIASLPAHVSGNTCACLNDYDEVCPYSGSDSPDVVYAYTAIADLWVYATLCEGDTDYDTKLYVYADTCPTPGSPLACNDDACSSPVYPQPYISELVFLELTGGTTYYFVVDGYGANCGDYYLDLEVSLGHCVECPPGGVPEGEVCGEDTNGGCNMDVPAFEAMNLGDTVCGTGWALDGTRDTDWYEVTTTEDVILTITVMGEFLGMNVVTGLVETIPPGTADCAAATGNLQPYYSGNACEEFSVVTECLPAGTYWPFVAPSAYYDYPCGFQENYYLTVTGEPCVIAECGNGVVEGEEECDGDDDDACPGACQANCTCPCPEDTITVILDTDSYGSEISWEIVDTGTANVIASGADYESLMHYEIDVCAESDGCFDFHIYDTYGDGGAAWEILLNGVPQGSGMFDSGYQESLWFFGSGCGAPPEGACCYEDGGCLVQTVSDCAAAGGAYQGNDTVCEPNPCPQPAPGDNCSVPLPMSLSLAGGVLPHVDTNTNCGRGDDYDDTETGHCLYYYDSGEDMIYEISVLEAMNIEITLDSKGTIYSGVAIGDACPPTESCLGSAYDSAGDPMMIECLHLEPDVYYLQVDTWSPPDCIPEFDLTIAECVIPTGACCEVPICTATMIEEECPGIWHAGEQCPDYACPARNVDTLDITESPALVARGPWDDDDGDEYPNACDNCPAIPNNDQADGDADGAGDLCDNCIDIPNGPDLSRCFDLDTGEVGDSCPGPWDWECPGGSICSDQTDLDGDSVGDICDPCPFDNPDDPDGDDYCSSDEECPYDPLKLHVGQCGCGVDPVYMCGYDVECEDDGDGVPDCRDQCPGVDDAIFAPSCTGAIPTVSYWGLVILALLLLVAGKVRFGRRRIVHN